MNYLLTLLLVFVIILLSMILHELAHGMVAYCLGDNTAKMEGRLTLNPFRHLDPIMSFAMPLLLFISGGPIFGGAKPVPVNTRNLKFGVWGMALVGIAGPLTNFLIAFVAFLLGYFTTWLFEPNLAGLVIDYIIMINLGFGVFNLLPIPPLDGSRVLYAIAPDGVRSVMQSMERYGIWIVLLLVVLVPSVIYGLMNGAIEGILHAFYWLVGVR